MSRLRFLRCLPLLLLALVPLCLGGEPEWVEVTSPHFSVVTDAGEKQGREVALRFEQMRAVFGLLMAKAKVNIPIPLQIVAFRNTKEMRQFAPIWQGKPTQVSGLFEGNTDRGFILLDMSAANPWQVVFHEYAHQLLNGNLTGQTQPWFEEGFAEYFSTITVKGKEADVGMIVDNDYQVLQQISMVSVADLFRVQQNSSTYNESGDRRSIFYAESWLVVHYMYDKKWVPKLAAYFTLAVDRGVPVPQAIQQAFGMSPADFDKELKKYLEGNYFLYTKIAAPAGIDMASSTTVKPLALADAKTVLADAHLHSPDYQEKAVGEFEEVLKLQPDNLGALRGLGYAYLIKRDYHRSGEYFTQAAAHNSDDPRVLYYSALLAQQEEESDWASNPERLDVIQKRLLRSVTLDPTFADAYRLLAVTYAAQGNAGLALDTMRKAVAVNPRNVGYQFDLAQMSMVSGNYDESIALLQQLSKSTDPSVAARARQLLPMAENAKQVIAGGTPARVQLVVPAGSAGAKVPEEPSAPISIITKPTPSRFLKGNLVSVDCSPAPAAVLTIVSGAQTWKLRAEDSAHVVVIGADNFSCAWSNQKVAVNFRETGDATGELISVEVQ